MTANPTIEENRLRRLSRTSDGRRASIIRPRRRSGSCSKVSVARTALPSCVAARDRAERLAGDTARAATSDEVNDLRREAMALKRWLPI